MIFQVAIAQQVAREEVLFEYFTGDWCSACPGASMGGEDLIANGHNVAVVGYHLNDVFANPCSAAKQSYYYVTEIPTAIFDGDLIHIGGDHYNSLYDVYLPLYEESISVLSDFTIDIEGVNSQLTDYVVDISVEKVAANSCQNLRLMIAVTETDIPHYWMDQEYVNHCERLMLPDAQGTNLDFSDDDILDFSFSFSLDTEWVQENCEIVIWVQDYSTKVVQQTIKRHLDDFGEFPENDVTIKRIYTPATMCNSYFNPGIEISNIGTNNLSMLDLVYQIDNEPEYTYHWTGDIPYGESEVINVPEIDYYVLNSSIFSVYLENPNEQDDEFPYNNSLSSTILEAQEVSSPITLVLKLDDFPEQTSWEVTNSNGNLLYSGGPYTEAGVFLTESFNLEENDCYTFTIYDSEGDGLAGTGIYKLMYETTVFQTGKDFGLKDEIEFEISLTDMEEVTLEDNIMIYPNPASNVLNIETSKPYKSVDILDMNARIISTYIMSNNRLCLDVSNITTGIYYLRFKSTDQVEYRKIVINSL